MNLPSVKPRCRQPQERKMIADMITASRMLFSVLLLFLPFSFLFRMLYLLCGVSDALDGFIARRMHTESEKGARLDSAADLFFAVAYVLRVLPRLSVPLWLWVWAAVIACAKAAVIVTASKKAHSLQIAHSSGNKLTGLFLFLLPLSVGAVDVSYGAALVCAVATVTVIREIVPTHGRVKKERKT